MNEKMVENARGALKAMLEVRPEDRVLIITDEATKVVGEAFAEAAKGLVSDVKVYYLPQDQRPLKEVPQDLKEMVPNADIGLTLFSGMAEETPFRIALIHLLMEHVRKVGHGPGITEDMLVSGPLAIDYDEMVETARYLMKRFDGATSVHITAPGGTDITLSIADRDFATDVFIEDGKWGNIPGGEIWCAPIEDSANGVIVCDGSIGDLGKVPKPVKLTVKDGKVVEIECEDKDFERRVRDVIAIDEMASVIGELGIGVNKGAKITGNLLEDEKAFHTAHIAFGNNLDMPGGRNDSKTHRDFLFHNPTFHVTYEDGRVERPIVDGEIVRVNVPDPVHKADEGAYKRILVAVDFSEKSRHALMKAHRIAEQFDSALLVCHIIPKSVSVNPLFPQYTIIESTDTKLFAEEKAMDALMDFVTETTGRNIHQFVPIIAAGQPASEIVRVAEDRDVDLIVVAHQGATGLARILLGSVAESIARHAHCSVLVVRTKD